MIESVLVANRGEIAVRILRTARELGIRTLAVFSEADRGAPHVGMADHAVLIGPAPSDRSYLDVDTLLAAAREFEIEAVHPGYGFLSERPEFARAVEAENLIFVGPRSETIEAMGLKTEARSRMARAGVPIVPGTQEPLSGPEEAEEVASELGYPVLVKAAAGGGGKGMRVVETAEELASAFAAAVREAEAAFGDGTVYLERYLARPRHIEIQLLGDTHGNVVHLGERECSVQRRHQKLLEEAPSVVLTPAERSAMGEAAVRAAKAANYVGAGTVEFLYQDGEFFFLEMNTRLQVEHPVTEMVTGLDLVEWQFRVASGEALPFAQEDIQLVGHSMECRITSEAATAGFLPSTGTVHTLEVPGGPGVRWDGGIRNGTEVGLYYDPLLGKLISYGADRDQAVRRMRRALDELEIAGIETSIPFHRRLLAEPSFLAGDLTIRYLEDHSHLLEPLSGDESPYEAMAIAAALLEDRYRRRESPPRPTEGGRAFSPWRRQGAW